MKKANRINSFIADIGSVTLSSMWFGWMCILMITIVIARNPPKDLQSALLDFFSVFLQTIGLVIINYTTSRESLFTRKLLTETHDTVMLEQSEIKEVLKDLQDDFGTLKNLLQQGTRNA